MNSRLPGQVLMQHGGGALQVVGGAGQDRIRTEQGPVGERARRPVRQAEAPGVDDAAAVGEAVERHMRVAADDIRSSTPTNASANHANGLLTSTISSSWRAVAWQNRTGPSPSTSTLTVRGSAARARWSRCAADQLPSRPDVPGSCTAPVPDRRCRTPRPRCARICSAPRWRVR